MYVSVLHIIHKVSLDYSLHPIKVIIAMNITSNYKTKKKSLCAIFFVSEHSASLSLYKKKTILVADRGLNSPPPPPVYAPVCNYQVFFYAFPNLLA